MGVDSIATVLILAYTMTIIGYLGHAHEAIPKWTTFLGMVIITSAYILMTAAKVVSKDKDKEKQKGLSKKLSISGYIMASVFFFAIHIFPQLTFHVRYYDIFGAIGYAVSALGASIIPMLLPVGYIICTMYYIFGGYQKVFEPHWVDRLHLVARTVLAVVYGMLSMKYLIK